MIRGAIRVEDLVKVYKTKETEVVALRGLSVEIGKGQIVSFMGPSGSGKTTLLNIVGGLDEPTAGRVYVDGVDITRMRGREIERYRLEKVGFIFQLFNLIPTLTAYENVELPLILGGKTSDEREARVGEILEQLGIAGRASHFPDELSGGEKQRVAVGCALANDPSMILADEPTGELDTVSAEKVMDIFLELTRQYEKTVLVATHDPRVARRTELIYLMEDGRIKSEYTPTEVPPMGRVEGIEVAVSDTEQAYVEWIKQRIGQLGAEARTLQDRLKRDEIDADTFTQKYLEIREATNAMRSELVRLGIHVES